ncbi:tRNA (N(6)-L-threonylcarbamoyladenosine(37)-C(2))-methylthiotransferase MtaB [Candidatus Nomurabacteria bacterium]|nr:tRNA (N(6)-L-threonylcarbamoyladenosine(37)-C(2))-methylthiotransferase MtaB [Candidatus Nomurabacteria bacterium]
MAERTAGFHTLGCKVNRYETDAVMQRFVNAGYKVLGFDEVCDVYVINTCTVTGEAARKSGQFIRRARKLNPHAVVIAMGCQIQINGSSPQADIVLGTGDKTKAFEMAEEFISGRNKKIADADSIDREAECPEEYDEIGPVTSFDGSRAFVKIEDGCNRFCSYCIIPYARGRVRSRSSDQVLEEVRMLAMNGFKEVVLTGIDLSAFGSDKGKGIHSLAEIAEEIALIDGIKRIRLGSLEPYSMTEDFIRRLSVNEKICPHFHLSLQSGSDSVLKRMNREYDTCCFAEVVSSITSCFRDVNITVDLITGFPGETDEEHQQTMDFSRKMDFMDMHIFKYSKREGTKAAGMKEQKLPEIVNERSRQLLELASEMKKAHLARHVGTYPEILAETLDGDKTEGYTANYMHAVAHFTDENDRAKIKPGEIYPVHVISSNNDSLLVKL